MWRRSAALAVLAMVAPLARAACPDFAPAKTFPSGGSGAAAVTAADFNDDGRVDLALLNPNTSRVVIVPGNGDGTFGMPTATYNVGADTSRITTGDFNGDSRTDLGISSYTANNITILLNRGDGTMNASSIAHPIASGTLADDFNVDGKVDLVVTRLNAELWVHAGRGDGTFGSPVVSPSATRGRAMSVAHVNADGKPDLVGFSLNGDTVRSLLGVGDGTFTVASESSGSSGGGRAMDTGDFDSDGRIDAVVANTNSGEMSVLLGIGGGQFGAAAKYPSGNSPWDVVVQDFTRDGRPDTAIANEFSDNVAIFIGNGNGTFAPALKYSVGHLPVGLATADFNADGKLDLAVANFDPNDVSILLSQDTCTPRRRPVRR